MSHIDDYNRPIGKIDLGPLGVFQNIVPAGVTATGVVNTGAGAEFSAGSDGNPDSYFGRFSTWDEMTSEIPAPVYIKYTPSAALPASCMVSAYIEYDGATPNTWNGTGEAALYGRFSADESDVRLLMYMGLSAEGELFQPSGWATPGDGQSAAFIVHYRDIFSEMPSLTGSGKTWADLKDVRLVFRNATDGRKVRVKEFHIYESVLTGPSGSVGPYTATQDSVTFQDVDIRGALSAVGAGYAGIVSLDLPVASATEAVTGHKDMGGVQTLSGDLVWSGLPQASRCEAIMATDGYGNIGYIADTYGATTSLPGTWTATADRDAAKAHLECSLNLAAGLYVAGYAMYSYQLAATGGNEWVPIEAQVFAEDTLPLPTVLSFDYDLDPTGGGLYKVEAYARSVITNINPDGTAAPTTYYFKYENDQASITDPVAPTLNVCAYSAQGKVVVSWRAEDASGIAHVEYDLVSTEGVETKLHEISYASGVWQREVEDTYEFLSTPGTTVTVRVNVTDGAGLTATEDVSTEVHANGTLQSSEFSIAPEVTTFIDSDGVVKLSWTAWDFFMPPVAGVRYAPVQFEIYRRRGVAGVYDAALTTLPATAVSYTDASIEEPDIYIYCIVGVDAFGQRKSIEVTADVTGATSTTQKSFIDTYLDMLPTWTAASSQYTPSEDL